MPDAAARTIEVDLPCVRCRYLLRGVDARGACPECALPIEESLDPRRLVFADRRWLRRVGLGAGLIAGGIPVYAIGLFVILVMTESGAEDRLLSLVVALAVLLPVVVLALVVLATMPDRWSDWRAVAGRWTAIAACVAVVGLCSTAPLFSALSPTIIPEWIVPVAALAGSFVVIFGTSVVWRQVAVRERNRPLKSFATLIAGWAPIEGLIVVAAIMLAISQDTGADVPDLLVQVVGMAASIGTFLLAAGWIAAAIAVALTLRRARREAVDRAALPSPHPAGS